MSEFVMTGRECRDVDRQAMRSLNLSEMQLMKRAARAALDKLAEQWPLSRHLAVYCGPGNNGGDGYLVAAGAKKLGYQVRLFALGSPGSETAQSAQKHALAEGLEITPISDDIERCYETRADLVVDALFGHGLERDIKSPLRELFERINQSSIPVFALDMPSGINSDTGAVMGVALKAEHTICFVAPKIGLMTGEGVDYAGELSYDNLGIPDAVSQQIHASYEWLNVDSLRRMLPTPEASSHKGNFGHVVVAGGQAGMPGAVILAALAAARSGSGRVTVASSEEHIHLIPQASPVLMTLAIGLDGLFILPESSTVLALGPGLGVADGIESGSNWSRDADGLNLLASRHRTYENWVLSPHPKEAAGLLGCSVEEIQSNRPRASQAISEQFGGVCVLKGRGSLVVERSGRKAICTHGNWGMATAGSGDVLSGIIAAFLGQGLAPYEAACAAVYVHANAGDLAAAQMSKRSMIASDIIDYLPGVFSRVEKLNY
jgi:NAD(P)H-hydrate epimerase